MSERVPNDKSKLFPDGFELKTTAADRAVYRSVAEEALLKVRAKRVPGKAGPDDQTLRFAVNLCEDFNWLFGALECAANIVEEQLADIRTMEAELRRLREKCGEASK